MTRENSKGASRSRLLECLVGTTGGSALAVALAQYAKDHCPGVPLGLTSIPGLDDGSLLGVFGRAPAGRTTREALAACELLLQQANLEVVGSGAEEGGECWAIVLRGVPGMGLLCSLLAAVRG